jgi:signal transduction histidine kinase
MDASKTQIVRNIESARAHLERALDDILQLPVRSDTATDLAMHTLGSYVVLAKNTVELLREELHDYPVRDVGVWLDGLARGTLLMEQLVEQIQSGTTVRQELVWEEVEIATLVRRLCRLYQTSAARRSVSIDFDAAVSTSRAWTDRIVAASVFHEILTIALRRSPANSTVKVHIEELEDRIFSWVQDRGVPLSQNGRRCLEDNEDVHFSRKSAERLGGRLWCEFITGEGLRVHVSLPKPGTSGVSTGLK